MAKDSPRYDPEQSLRDAREVYFRHFGFDSSTYTSRWVKLKAGPIPFYFPNVQARVIAVKYHDLHHILTGYPANWAGEGEIGAWEVASGCKHHWPAWILNLDAMAIGLLLAPGKVYRAFLRGRQSENLYGLPFDDGLLGLRVGEARKQLHLEEEKRPARGDTGAFIAWSIIAIAVFLGPIFVTAFAILQLTPGIRQRLAF